MKKLILILLLIPCLSSAQKINWDNFNSEIYNNFLSKEISKVRANKIAPKYDTTLLKAAKYHGYYSSINNLVGHYDTSSLKSRTCSDRIRMFIPSAHIVSYYTLCPFDVLENSYSREIVCSFSFDHKIRTYEDLAIYTINVYRKSPGHWENILYKFNNKNTSSSEKFAGFSGIVNGKVYSVILFYDDVYYNENKECFHTLIQQMIKGTHDSAYTYVQINNELSINNSTRKIIDIGGDKLEINVSIDYMDHIDKGLMSSMLTKQISQELTKRENDYIKKARF